MLNGVIQADFNIVDNDSAEKRKFIMQERKGIIMQERKGITVG